MMWQVAPLSTNHLLLGSPTPTLKFLRKINLIYTVGFSHRPLNSGIPGILVLHTHGNLLMNVAWQILQHLDQLLALGDPHPGLPLHILRHILGHLVLLPHQLLETCFPFLFLSSSFHLFPYLCHLQQAFLPQWLHFLGSGQFSAKWPFFPQLKHVLWLPHRLCHMDWTHVTLNSRADIIILNSKENLLHCRGILMQLKKLLHFPRQISHIQQKLITFTDSDISQLGCNNRSFQHWMKRFNLCLHFSHDVGQMIWLLHSKPDTLLTISQGFRFWSIEEAQNSTQWSPKPRFGSWSSSQSCCNHWNSAAEDEKVLAPHGLIMVPERTNRICWVDGFSQFWPIGIMNQA